MKILTIGTDNRGLDANSQTAKRMVEYGDIVAQYDALVPNGAYETVDLSTKARVFGSGGCCKPAQLWRIYRLADTLIKQNQYSVISVQDTYFLAFICLLLARKHKIGAHMQVHGFERFTGVRKVLARFLIKRFDEVRVVSERLKKELVGDFGVGEANITVVNIYTELGQIKVKKDDYNAKGRIKILTVSRIVPVKNIALLVSAFFKLKEKSNLDAELWIAGDGSERAKMELEVKKSQLGEYVKILGWQDKDGLEVLYKKADIFALVSKAEGWGLAVIEAAARGLPVIMTDVGCAGEVIINNESGLVIPVNDQKSLEEAIMRLAKDMQLRQKLGQNARVATEGLPNKEDVLRLYLKSWEKAERSRNVSVKNNTEHEK